MKWTEEGGMNLEIKEENERDVGKKKMEDGG